MTWEEAYYRRWWPPDGSRVALELGSGERVTGTTDGYAHAVMPGVGPTRLLLVLRTGRMIEHGEIVSLEVLDDGPAAGARGEAEQAASLALVPGAEDQSDRVAA